MGIVRPRDAAKFRQGPVRGRFAPSPTGPLHFGSLVAALGSYLEARHRGGEWLVRIEDVDAPRVVPGATDKILRMLERCGLLWDGPVVYQSRRTERYQAALERLSLAGLAYSCTCSRSELAACARARNGSLIYPGYCRNGIRRSNRPGAIRLRTTDIMLAFRDALHGDYCQHLETEVGDFVIRRADGLFAYQLAVVVDDADQAITQVVRGSDLLDSTPRQIYLQQQLGLSTPEYAHLPVVVDARGDKLSKQIGAPPLDDRHPGPALWAALRFLGQQPSPALATAPAAEIVSWAVAHWQLERAPAVPARRWDTKPIESIEDGLTHTIKAID